MKMIKHSWILIAIVLTTSSATGQKVTVKDGNIYANGSHYAIIKKEGCRLNTDCYLEVFDTSGKKEIVIKPKQYSSWEKRTSGNPNGYVYYLEFIFLSSGQKAETHNVSFKLEKMAAYLIKQNLFEKGLINEKAVNEFVLINGRNFSK